MHYHIGVFFGEWYVYIYVAYSVYIHMLAYHYLMYRSTTIMKPFSSVLSIPMFRIICYSQPQLEKDTPEIP
jgi:hypothetical protein